MCGGTRAAGGLTGVERPGVMTPARDSRAWGSERQRLLASCGREGGVGWSSGGVRT